MFKKMMLCSIAAGLAISLAACGQSDEAKCKELMMPAFSDSEGKLFEGAKKDFDQAVKSCVAGAKLMK